MGATSALPASSRHECMESMGLPTSTVGMPVRAAVIGPIVEQLAADYAGKAKVAKLDVDNNQKTAARFNVRSIPTILFFMDGKLVDQVVGAVPRPALEAKFKEHA